MKTYVLLVRRTYPKGHKREGENTFFVEKIMHSLFNFNGSEGIFFTAKDFEKCCPDCAEKFSLITNFNQLHKRNK